MAPSVDLLPALAPKLGEIECRLLQRTLGGAMVFPDGVLRSRVSSDLVAALQSKGKVFRIVNETLQKDGVTPPRAYTDRAQAFLELLLD